MTDTKKLMREFLGKFKVKSASPLMGAAISGRLDVYIAREAVEYAKSRGTVTFGEIRASRNNALGVTND